MQATQTNSVLSFWRPQWPAGESRDGRVTGVLRLGWRLAAVVYTLISMTAVYLIGRAFRPVQRVLSGLATRPGKNWTGTGWAACLLAIGGCMLVSMADPAEWPVMQGFSPSVCAGLTGLLGYLLLGGFRWTALNLMERETNYRSYGEMLSRFEGGVFGSLAAEFREPTDILWVRHLMVTSLVHLPPTIALFVWGTQTWFVWAWFAVTILATVKTPSLNHNVGHYRPFAGLARKCPLLGRGLGLWYAYIVEFAEGDVPHLAIAGHNLVHHAENNGPGDFESTYPYDRTSFTDTSLLYLNCMASYSFSMRILDYLWQRRAKKAYRQAIRDILKGLSFAYGSLILVAVIASVQVALFILIIRLVQSGLKFGRGAYVTHPFVDPDDPTNSYKNSLDFAAKGTLTHGGGVHILHHSKPMIHWSDLKRQRSVAVSDYAENGAIVIPLEAGSYLQPLMFSKRFDLLARLVMDSRKIEPYENGSLTLEDLVRSRETKCVVLLLERRARPRRRTPPGRPCGGRARCPGCRDHASQRNRTVGVQARSDDGASLNDASSGGQHDECRQQ